MHRLQRIIAILILAAAFSMWTALALTCQVNADTPTPGRTPARPAPSEAATDALLQTNLFPAALVQSVDQQADALDLLRKAVERLRNDDEGLEVQRRELEKLARGMSETKAALRPKLAAVDREIQQLGPAPEAAETVEIPQIIQERSRLKDVRARIIAAQKRTDLSILRAQKLEEQIQEYHLQNFVSGILKPSDSPASAALWRNLDAALPRVWIQINTIANNWWTEAKLNPASLLLTFMIGVLCYTALFYVRQRILNRALDEPSQTQQGFLHRAVWASWFVLIMVLPGAAAAISIFIAGDLLRIWGGQIRPVITSALTAFLIFSLVTALATALLQPQRPGWRLVGMPTGAARRLLWTTNTIAAVYAADLFIHHVMRLFFMPVEIGILETSLANCAFAVLLAIFALTPLPNEYSGVSSRHIKIPLNIVRIPLVLVAIVIVSVTLAGYVALGRFIAGQIMLMGAGGIFVLLMHFGIRAFATSPEWLAKLFGHIISNSNDISKSHWNQIVGFIAVIANMVLIGAALALLLLSWGIPLSQLLDHAQSLFFGFEIGEFQISLFNILIGLCLFSVVIFLTRIIQAWMDRSLLNAPTVDRGIANSIHTGLGYLGFGLAGLVGISYVGIDLTQITLVIGALSLGVGLGLQSIVNNFVSGLILLVERPVKVGDWVVIGDEQGYVRKISVRATEIETFDRASVIIPNSALISGTVQNWTHHNPMGRIIIPVGVSYNADPQEVYDILLDIARNSEEVLGFPEPFVAFDNFGASSLDFSLRCYLSDINNGLSVKTALRIEILKQFKERGIEIPYPQHDVHLRDLAPVTSALTEAQQQIAARAANIDGKPQPMTNDGKV